MNELIFSYFRSSRIPKAYLVAAVAPIYVSFGYILLELIRDRTSGEMRAALGYLFIWVLIYTALVFLVVVIVNIVLIHKKRTSVALEK